MSFAEFFSAATGIANGPFDYQRRLACGERQPGEPDDDWLSRGTKCESKLINIPTGLGKTAAVVLAWLWNRLRPPLNNQPSSINSPEWPRRLVYCLPMRTLVEQTQKEVRKWLVRLARKYTKPQDGSELRWLALHSPNILMGGAETDRDWDVRPEKPAILIGTQDMLLSRALNRGYGMSRYRWPMHFGLLHADCLWVFDEIQLMGCGLATTAQLEAFRNRLGQSDCASFWMSATLQKDWLKTVDYADPSALPLVKLEEDDLQNSDVRERREARKPIQPATARMEDWAGLAAGILNAHERAGSRTLVVVNTVKRARDLSRQLQRLTKSAESKPELVLIHSRFLPGDRRRQVKRLFAEPGAHGMIVVSTQVVEAVWMVRQRRRSNHEIAQPRTSTRFALVPVPGKNRATGRRLGLSLRRNHKASPRAGSA